MYQNSLSDPRVRLSATRFYGLGMSQGKPLGAAQSNTWGVGTSVRISTLYAHHVNNTYGGTTNVMLGYGYRNFG